ncbi:MAG TPA: ribosome biogenesis GTPase Der [Pseudomonadales bacterium]|nr:ribosome biogenesis GTPase Der [Pseudomonadales bacterium]
MLPVIALVGRPNVGKSTLFNRITRTRNAIVANYSGLTRDRQYGEASFEGRRFIVVDTGGLGEEEHGIDNAMAGQSLTAIEEADIVLFLVDCRAGLASGDELIARHLRAHHKKTFLVINKSDGLDPDIATSEFFALGFSEVHPIAAVHGRGVSQLLEHVMGALYPDVLQPVGTDDESVRHQQENAAFTEVLDNPEDGDLANTPAVTVASRSIKIAIVGRPNVGKSTLVNRMLGEDRVVVFDLPGTTRDSIYIDYERNGDHFTLIDTAGIRKRKNITEAIEKFSIVKTLQAIEDANVVILVMDAQEGIVEQDMHLLGHVIEKGRALVVAINKWDGLDEEQRNNVKRTLDRRLQFINFAAIHFISALHGSGVGNLYASISKAYKSATQKLSTNALTLILQDAVASHPPPMFNGRRIKLRYAHAGGQNPPIVIIHGNQVDKVPDHYTRYLENIYRKALQLSGTPLRIEYRTGENPFEGRRNTLTPRQQQKRKRLVKHLKKRDR